MTARTVNLTSFYSVTRLLVFLLFGSLLILSGCDSADNSAMEEQRAEPWLDTWKVLSTTSPGTEVTGPIEIVYEDIGVQTYWILEAERTIELTAVDGENGCGRVEADVTEVSGKTMTINNGIYVFTVAYDVSGDQLFAEVIDAVDEPDLIGTTWEAVRIAGDPFELAGC